jgi:hypothetical protein
MTAKIDGTNGLLQNYDYQVLTTAFSYTFAAGTQILVINPAGTLATGTITMPAAPADGMTITFSSTQTITALTVNANTGQSIVSAPTVLPARQAGAYIYRLSNTTWYPYESVPTNVPVAPAGGSIITSGTAVASTSGTSIEFTALPSWIKRITVLFNGVSTNSSSIPIIQLGTGATPTYTTTGYSGAGTSNATIAAQTTGFATGGAGGATYVRSGSFLIQNVSGNIWVFNGALGDPSALVHYGGGGITLGAALTAVRITNVVGTDVFDAGSINIFYE